MRFLTTTVAAVAFGLSAHGAFAACDDHEMVIKFSHVTNTDRHPKGLAAARLQERVNVEMDGVACMEVYPNSTLYTDEKVLQAMLQGDVQLAAPSLSLFERFTKQFRIFDLPFMFQDIDAVNAFQASEYGQALKDSMRHRGLQGLEFWHNGMKQMSADRPLLHPNDAAGLKFRIQPSDVLVAQMEVIGGSGHKIAFAESYSAIKEGVVDGQENTWSNIYGRRIHKIQDGITETNHGIIDYLVVTSVDWLSSLDPKVRDQLLQILREVTEERNAQSEAVNEQAKQAIIDSGGVVRRLTPEQRAAWIEAMRPVWDQFRYDVGAENIEAAQAFSAQF